MTRAEFNEKLNISGKDVTLFDVKAYENIGLVSSGIMAKADREQFVYNLGWLLSQTCEGIKGAYLDDQEYVHVVYSDDYEVLANVNMDSYLAIIKDVVKHL